jgi:site-specific DNA-methyltransferase (adenine-specific)
MWNGMLHGSSVFNGHIMKGNKKLNQKRIHPTEKPFEIYEWCNHIYQPKNILSNFVGSGSDRISAHKMNIDFYGCELSETHFNNQEKRFKQIISQQKLFTT